MVMGNLTEGNEMKLAIVIAAAGGLVIVAARRSSKSGRCKNMEAYAKMLQGPS
ncbi:MAG: hypothetical protein HC843_13715 [Sphingomonadales bacterium]|nr:hypothetical protein [Sphingomonadales bacterium]